MRAKCANPHPLHTSTVRYLLPPIDLPGHLAPRNSELDLAWLSSPDVFLGIDWDIEQEPEVVAWFDALGPGLRHVAFQIDRLLFAGSALRMPHSRALGDGRYELRFDLDTIAWRITYFFTEPRRIVPRGAPCPRSKGTLASPTATLQTRNEMTRTKWTELRDDRLATFSDDERDDYDRAYRAAALAAGIGESKSAHSAKRRH